MKLICLFLFVALMQVSAITYSQNTKLKVVGQNLTIGEVFDLIENQSEFSFFYNVNQIDLSIRISINARDQVVNKILDEVLAGTGLTYTVNNKLIVIHKQDGQAVALSGQADQERKVTGKVTDATGASLPGASVVVKGTTAGVITDNDGNYIINIPENAILVYSFVGMKTQEIAVGNQPTINVTLEEETIEIEEVVATGYGTQKKNAVTSAIQKIDGEKIINRPVTSLSSLLQGEVAGLSISTPSGGFTPGSSPTIQIRSQAALNTATPPLIVIDGIPSTMSEFNNLNPNDIENFSVLKDAAAAAIYGARAPYGVILITTKIGNKNKKPVVQYNGNYAIGQPIRLPEMVDSYTFVLSKKQSYLNDNVALNHPSIKTLLENIALIKDNVDNPGKYTSAELNPGTNGTWGFGTTSFENNDFFKVWFKDAERYDHNISIKGGTDKTDYYFSGGYLYQGGILNFVESIDNYKRFNLNGTISSQINNWFKLSYRTRNSFSRGLEPSLDYDYGRSQIYDYAYGAYPTTPVKNPDGTYNQGARIAMAIQSGNRTDDNYRFDNTLSFDINPLKAWNIHVDGNWRYSFRDYQNLRKPAYQGIPNSTSMELLAGTESSISKLYQYSNYWTVQGYTTYEKNINKHYFKAMVGAQIEEQLYKQLSGSAKKLFDENKPVIDLSTDATSKLVSDALSDWATVGTFGRFNYNFDERYLLEINARYDGSGRYSEGNRWGLFPSVSTGWIMSRESFWRSLDSVINHSKLRLSYGTLGNQGNSPGYIHIPTLAIESQTPWIFNGTRIPYVQTPGMTNYNRTWEKITTLNIGVDLGFFNNRLFTEFDWFNRLSWDILGPPNPLPSVLGTTPLQINNTEFVTKGWELQLKWKDKLTKKIDYGVQFYLSDALSKITEYNTSQNIIGSYYPGMEIGEIWGYKATRLLNKDDFDGNNKLLISQSNISSLWYPGDVKYEDLNDDKTITRGLGTLENHGDLVKIGNGTPRYNFSFSLSAGYKFDNGGRVDFSAMVQGVGKHDVVAPSNGYYFWGVRPAGPFTLASVYKGDNLNFYRDENSDPDLLALLGLNIDSKFPRPYGNGGGLKNFENSTLYLLNGAYARLKNVQVSYTLPNQWMKKAGMQGCKIYLSGENLFQLTELPKYLDSELIEGRAYPQQAVYSMGINLSF